jgi:hypothetical protein
VTIGYEFDNVTQSQKEFIQKHFDITFDGYSVSIEKNYDSFASSKHDMTALDDQVEYNFFIDNINALVKLESDIDMMKRQVSEFKCLYKKQEDLLTRTGVFELPFLIDEIRDIVSLNDLKIKHSRIQQHLN